MNWRLGIIFAIVIAVVLTVVVRARSRRGPDGPGGS